MIDHMKVAREFAMRRICGTTPDAQRRMNQERAGEEWAAVCRKCGNPVKGTRAALSKGCPVCNEGDPHA